MRDRSPNRNRSQTPVGLLLIIGTGVLWGTIGVASKEITKQSSLDAVSITWLRSVIASPVCLVAAWLALGRRTARISRPDFLFMVLLGGVLILYQWLYLAAIAEIGVSAATLISLCGSPVIVALLSSLMLGESLLRPVLLALGGAILGTVLLVGTPSRDDTGNVPLGLILAIGCALGIALHTLGSRRIANRVHPLLPPAIGFPVGAILFTPVAISRGVSLDVNAPSWILLIYLGVVPSSIAYVFYQRGLRDVPATVATVVTMLEPLIAAVLAWVFFDERLGIWGWVGGLLLLGSIWLLSLQTQQASAGAKTPEIPI